MPDRDAMVARKREVDDAIRVLKGRVSLYRYNAERGRRTVDEAVHEDNLRRLDTLKQESQEIQAALAVMRRASDRAFVDAARAFLPAATFNEVLARAEAIQAEDEHGSGG